MSTKDNYRWQWTKLFFSTNVLKRKLYLFHCQRKEVFIIKARFLVKSQFSCIAISYLYFNKFLNQLSHYFRFTCINFFILIGTKLQNVQKNCSIYSLWLLFKVESLWNIKSNLSDVSVFIQKIISFYLSISIILIYVITYSFLVMLKSNLINFKDQIFMNVYNVTNLFTKQK